MKIVLAIVAVLAVAAGGAWFFLVRAPSPDEVCAHMVKLAEKEGIKELDKAECVKDVTRRKETMGVIKYAKKAKCITAASTLADGAKCD